jgi:hypothetical protein
MKKIAENTKVNYLKITREIVTGSASIQILVIEVKFELRKRLNA